NSRQSTVESRGRRQRVSYVNIAATMTTTSSAPITHSAVDENVQSYMPETSLLVSSNLDARCRAKVYQRRARYDLCLPCKNAPDRDLPGGSARRPTGVPASGRHRRRAKGLVNAAWQSCE